MGSQHSRISSHDRAILNLKIQRDQLKHYQRKIDLVLQRETEIARECLKIGDRRRALLALRQRKYQEALLLKTDAQLDILYKLTSSIEFSVVEKDVFYGLQQGSEVLKNMHKELSIERAEQILDTSVEAIQYQEDLSAVLSTQMTNADEEEALAEFDRLQLELSPILPIFPNAPNDPLFIAETIADPVITTSEQDTEAPSGGRSMEAA